MKCIDCGEDIDRSSSVCPFCGCIYKKEHLHLNIILILIIISLVIGILILGINYFKLDSVVKIISCICICCGVGLLIKSVIDSNESFSVSSSLIGTIGVIFITFFVYLGFYSNFDLISDIKDLSLDGTIIPVICEYTNDCGVFNLLFKDLSYEEFENASYVISYNLKGYSDEVLKQYKQSLINNGYILKDEYYISLDDNRIIFIKIINSIIVYGVAK